MKVIGLSRMSIRNRLVLLLAVLALVYSAAYLVTPLVSKTLAAPTVNLEDGIEGCMGVRTTPGSLNTTKELVGGTLEPGGSATFRFTFPATVQGNPGQEQWKLTDCVFLNGDPLQKYTVTAFANDVSPCSVFSYESCALIQHVAGTLCFRKRFHQVGLHLNVFISLFCGFTFYGIELCHFGFHFSCALLEEDNFFLVVF